MKEMLKKMLKKYLTVTKGFVAELIFFVFKISESLLEPTLRLYIYRELCVKFSNFTNESVCRNLSLYPKEEEKLQSQAAIYLTMYRVLVNFPALFLCVFCGSWSDRVGRKLPIIISSSTSILGILFFLINCCLSDFLEAMPTNAPSTIVVKGENQTSEYLGENKGYDKRQITFLIMMFFGSLFRGLSGKGSIVTMAVHSYISDVSDESSRTERLGRLLSMNFFGLFAGSLLVGICLEKLGFTAMFAVVIVLHFVCIVFALLFMETTNGNGSLETSNSSDDVPLEKQNNNGNKRAKLILFHWKNVYDFFILLKNFPSSRVFYFFVVIVIQQACKSGEVDVTLLYTMKAPLSWSQSTYGYFLATDYACLGLATSALLPILIKVFGARDVSLAIIGVSFKIVRVVIMAVSSATWVIFMSAVCGCPSALIISCLKSLVSKSFHEKDLGKIFALLSGCETFSNLIGNVIFNQIYVSTFSFFAGFIFCVDAFIFFFLLMGLIYIGCSEKDDQEKPLCPGQLESDDYGAVKKIPTIILER